MWTYLVYSLSKYLDKYPDKIEELEFNEFSDFIFEKIGKKKKLLFWDGNNDLLSDFIYAKDLGLVDIYGIDGISEESDGWGGTVISLPTDSKSFFENVKIRIGDMEKIRKVEKIVDNSSYVSGMGLISEYNNRIKQAINSLPETSQYFEYNKRQ